MDNESNAKPESKTILMFVTYSVHPGQREAFYQALKAAMIPDLSRAEEGNLEYAYFYSGDHSDEILLIEQWRDASSLEFHKSTVHYAHLQELKKKFVIDVKMVTHTLENR